MAGEPGGNWDARLHGLSLSVQVGRDGRRANMGERRSRQPSCGRIDRCRAGMQLSPAVTSHAAVRHHRSAGARCTAQPIHLMTLQPQQAERGREMSGVGVL